MRFLRWGSWGGLAGLTVAACSLVNAPPDPSPASPAGTGGGATSTGGSDPATGGAGGTGGVGGTGGAIPGSCGDGVVDEGEACDDGGESATCDVDCTPVECGDRRINRTAGEGCDDGNEVGDDACDPTCQPSVFDVEIVPGDPSFLLRLFQSTVRTVVNAQGEERFLVAYTKLDPDGVGTVHTRSYDAVGMSLGQATQISNGASFDVHPAIAQNDNGAIIVAWVDGDVSRVRYRLLEPDGTPTAFGDTINDPGMAGLAHVVAALPNGNFVIQWHDDTNRRLKLLRVDEMGMPDGPISNYADSDPSFEGRSNGVTQLFPYQGGFISLFWSTPTELSLRLLNGAASTVGSATVVHATEGDGWLAGAVVTGGTNFLVALSSQPNTPDYEVTFQPMLNQNTLDGAPTSFTPANTQHVGFALAGGNGRQALVYGEPPTGAAAFEGCSLRISEVDAAGVAVGSPTTLVPLTIADCPVFADAAVNAEGDLFVVWTRLTAAGFGPQGILLPGYLAAP